MDALTSLGLILLLALLAGHLGESRLLGGHEAREFVNFSGSSCAHLVRHRQLPGRDRAG